MMLTDALLYEDDNCMCEFKLLPKGLDKWLRMLSSLTKGYICFQILILDWAQLLGTLVIGAMTASSCLALIYKWKMLKKHTCSHIK